MKLHMRFRHCVWSCAPLRRCYWCLCQRCDLENKINSIDIWGFKGDTIIQLLACRDFYSMSRFAHRGEFIELLLGTLGLRRVLAGWLMWSCRLQHWIKIGSTSTLHLQWPSKSTSIERRLLIILHVSSRSLTIRNLLTQQKSLWRRLLFTEKKVEQTHNSV